MLRCHRGLRRSEMTMDVCLGDDISLWMTGCCPCSTSPFSMSLIDPKEQQNRYSLAPVPTQELPEWGCRQQWTALGASTPDFSSRFIPEALPDNWMLTLHIVNPLWLDAKQVHRYQKIVHIVAPLRCFFPLAWLETAVTPLELITENPFRHTRHRASVRDSTLCRQFLYCGWSSHVSWKWHCPGIAAVCSKYKLTAHGRSLIVLAFIHLQQLSSTVKASVQRQPRFPECRHVINIRMRRAQKHLNDRSVG